VHAELRAILDERLGPQPLPGPIYREGHARRDEFFSLSPPLEVLVGAGGLLFFLPITVVEFTGRRELLLLVVAVLSVVGLLTLLVRGLIRIRWWWRARRIALRWCAEHQHVMPYDLRW